MNDNFVKKKETYRNPKAVINFNKKSNILFIKKKKKT